MNEFIYDFELKEIHLFDCHSNLKSAIDNNDDLFICSQIVTAARQIKSTPLRELLTLLLSESAVNDLDFSSMQNCKPENVKTLTSELYHAVQVSKAIQTGFIYEEKKRKYHFNANLFADYFLSRVRIVCDESGLLYAYNKNGFYKVLSDVEIGKLVRMLMNEGLANSWKSSHEKEAIEAIKRECPLRTEIDSIGDYINLKNGMYSLVTGVLKQHQPDFLSTVQIPLEYDNSATCPKFKKFMYEITCGDEQLIAVHQEIMGYLLSSEIKSEKAFYYFGRGANGKSVLAKLISILVGEQNVSSVPLSQFSSSFGLEGIIGKSVNIAPENEMQGSQLNTEAFKAIVSGDGININLKYRQPLTNYKSRCRLLFLGNELPDTKDLTNGYFRRMCILPFNRTFNEAERNRNLLNELTIELPGIFNWAMEGLKRLREQDFIFSYAQAIEDELNKYRLMQNPVLGFYEAMIELNESSRIKRADVFEYFKFWCEKQGIDYIATRTRQRFYKDFTVLIDGKNLPIGLKRIQGYEYFEGFKFKEF